MGSKKHKKDSKKRKHRSRSHSPSQTEDRERKRHRKHKERKRESSPDVQEVPVDSHLAPPPAPPELSPPPPPLIRKEGQESLSVEETNRLRAKLGLKPLQVSSTSATSTADHDDGLIKDDLGEFYHKPAVNISEQKKTEKIKEKLEECKERRKIEKKYRTVRTVGEKQAVEVEDEEDAAAWVARSRAVHEQRRRAERTAAELDERDEALTKLTQTTQYGARQLRGLRVAHDIQDVESDQEVVLTLEDREVLQDGEDVLVNENLLDIERRRKAAAERKKMLGYRAYDDEIDVSVDVLPQYAELPRPSGFLLGERPLPYGPDTACTDRKELIGRRLESLRLPEPRVASDYLDEHEINVKFKKHKKKDGVRSRTRASAAPLDVDLHDAGLAPLHTDDTDVNGGASGLVVDEEEVEVDSELQRAVARARRLHALTRAYEQHTPLPQVEEILQHVKEEEQEEMSDGMVLDSTAEFCRALGDIPTYGLAGNRDHHAELMELDREERDAGAGVVPMADAEPEEEGGAWSRVDVDNERTAELVAGGGGAGAVEALGAEPALGAGVGGALRLALSKGYLQRARDAPARHPRAALLHAAHYSIEDKTYGEEEKGGRRERGYSGPAQEFRENTRFRPNIKLEYVDDEGRPLCPKEAFRYLSHKFHGKGPGKNKQEKRIKKQVQEGLMKKMSSTDTPLGTLQMLQDKQRETRSPYVLLSGARRDAR